MANASRRSSRVGLIAITIAAALYYVAIAGNRDMAAQTPVSAAPADNLQRTTIINTYREVADSGVGRGETLYFYKCWYCHNEYGDHQGPALEGMFARGSFATGQPVNDTTVATKVNEGGPLMPAFKHSLTAADMADLLAFLKSERCCQLDQNPPPANPRYLAQQRPWPVPSTQSNGPYGTIRIASQDLAEGIGVQVIAPNNVRITVYTDADGRYEFPELQTGTYQLRIATPREFAPYHRTITVRGSDRLDDIVLDKIGSETGSMPATRAVADSLTSAELLWNLPGTSQEKDSFLRACTSCHAWQQVFRVRHDARGWEQIVERMSSYSSTWLGPRKRLDENGRATNGEVLTDEDRARVAAWLARVRGPNAQDPEYHGFPRPQGASTRVIVTEYELPRQLLALHDAWGDGNGGIWFTSHRTLYAGKVDAATGVVTDYMLPPTEGKVAGTHAVRMGKDGVVLLSENWADKLDILDPKTGRVTQLPNFSTGNFGTSNDGAFVWYAAQSTVFKMDLTGNIVAQWPGHCDTSSYENPISWDGKFWAGGGRPSGNNCAGMLNLETGEWHHGTAGRRMSTAKRGAFSPSGSAFFGGGNGALIELHPKSRTLRDHFPPTTPSPYTYFYEANVDKNGHVWAGALYGREVVRLDPSSDPERWWTYWLAEPVGFNRRTYIDNSTNPVSIWYADYNLGTVVRLQPRQ